MVGTNASINKKYNRYNETVQAISRGGGLDCDTNLGDLCVLFFDMGYTVKIQVENGLYKQFNFQGHKVDVYYQDMLMMIDVGLYYGQEKNYCNV